MPDSDIFRVAEEFYSFLSMGKNSNFEENIIYKNSIENIKKGFDILKKNTDNFSKLKKNELLDILNKETNFEPVVEIFFNLTNTTDMNFQTFFLQQLLSKNLFKTIIIENNGKQKLKMEYNDEEISRPKKDTMLKYAMKDVKIKNELIEFFTMRGLIEKLKSLNKMDFENEIQNIIGPLTVKYRKMGPEAEKSGEFAEEIIQKKLKDWGLIPGIDFNKLNEDVSLSNILMNTLDNLEKKSIITKDDSDDRKRKMTNYETTREFDIVLRLKDPKIIVQSVFYTSNTGGIASKKTDQNINTKNIMDEIIPDRQNNLKFILFLDGPGWVKMADNFQKSVKVSDDFFQIKTTDTKFKRILNESGLVCPIDVEVCILEIEREDKKPTKKAVVDKLINRKNINVSIDSILNQNKELNDIEDEKILKNSPQRKEIIEKFLGIEKILTSTGSTPPEKFIIKAASTITEYVSDVDFNKDLKKLKFSDGEIEKILKTLSGDGTIIVQKI